MSKTDPKDIIQIQDLGWEGEGVGRLPDGNVVFVEGALPGDKIVPRFGKKTGKGPLKAEIHKIASPSPNRIEHPCPHYAENCPASPLGAYKYEAALEWKRSHLIETLKRIGGIFDPIVAENVPAEQKWGYRDRIELRLRDYFGKISPGYMSKSGFIAIKDCLLPSQPVRNGLTSLIQALDAGRIDMSFMAKIAKPEHDPRLLIRDNGHGGSVAVLFVTDASQITNRLLTSILRETVLTGIQLRITDKMDLRFFVSEVIDEVGVTRIFFPTDSEHELYAGPTVFTQTNTGMSGVLRRLVLENLPSGGKIIDMFGGYGAYGLDYILSKGGSAVVIDSSHESVKAGRKFASKYNLPIEFLDVNLNRPNFRLDGKKYDALIVDPPRKGLDKNIVERLNDEGPVIFIYVSCHPAALARDLKSFDNYKVEKFIPIDLFPQTPELETVCVLKRK